MQEQHAPIVIGRIGGVFGVRGWMKITSYTRPKENIFTYSPWRINFENDWKEIQIKEFQQRGERLLVKIVGIDSPEVARQFIHCDIAILREQLPRLTDDKHYWYDLIGLEVHNQDDVVLGKVNEIAETGANDVLVIMNDANEKILIPFVKGVYVKKVDLNASLLRVEWHMNDDLSA